MTPGEPSIHDRIETLYRVFEGYRFTDPEPGRYGDLMPQLLQPVRRVPFDALERYLTTLISIYGDQGKSIRHFLPRLCELLYAECSPGHYYASMNTEFVMVGLHRNQWQTWPDEEVQAIEQFICAWWHELINAEPDIRQLEMQHDDNRPMSWLSDKWAGLYTHPNNFLSDIEHLQNQLVNDLRQRWADAIAAEQSLGPVTHLAVVYANANEHDLERLDDWYKQPKQCHALYNAWFKYQAKEPLGSLLSDAHANAELICAN